MARLPTGGQEVQGVHERTGKSGFRERSEDTRRKTVWPVVSVDYQTGEEEGRGSGGCEGIGL